MWNSESLFDLIVIGAGPAGSAASSEALKGGLSVLQLEKERFPRIKPCAGGLTNKSWQLLPGGLTALCRGEFQDFEFNLWKERRNHFGSSSPILRFVYRPEFDQALVERNQSFEKFSFLDAEPVRELGYDGHFWVRTEKKVFRGKQLVGADGAHSLVNRVFKVGSPRARATALEVVLPRTEFSRLSEGRDLPCFDFGAIAQGYGWVFPKDDHWSAGLYTLDDRPRDAKKALLSFLDAKGFQPSDHLLASLESHRYPVGGYELTEPKSPLYLVGDAGGFAEAVTGEGIYYALESGKLAGKVACSVQFGLTGYRDYYNKLQYSVLSDTFFSYKVAQRLYRNPGRWLRMLEVPLAWRPLVQGYSEGKTLTASILSVLPSLVKSIGRVKRSGGRWSNI